MLFLRGSLLNTGAVKEVDKRGLWGNQYEDFLPELPGGIGKNPLRLGKSVKACIGYPVFLCAGQTSHLACLGDAKPGCLSGLF